MLIFTNDTQKSASQVLMALIINHKKGSPCGLPDVTLFYSITLNSSTVSQPIGICGFKGYTLYYLLCHFVGIVLIVT